MKKIAFSLAILLFSAPAWATVSIYAEHIPDTNQVEILYVSDGNLPRAFGLDITVSDGNIVAVIPAMEGECTATVRGYGIFPGTIDIDDTVTPPVINTHGTPVAPPGARGALGGLDTNGVTIEMASLYEGPNAPPLSGVLCTIVVSSPACVNIAGNTALCGVEGSEAPGDAIGVVMEDPTEAVSIVYVPCYIICCDCFPHAHPDYAEWTAVGKPDCWCAISHPRQCYGDTDGLAEGKGNYWVYSQDLITLLNAWGKPLGALIGNEICADFDHGAEGKGLFRVYSQDLIILLNNWGTNTVNADCP
jgi:hypothetical protein